MGTHATLHSITSENLTPEFIQEFSTKLSLPLEKTSHALKILTPSLLMAFTHYGSSIKQLINKNLSGHELVKAILGNELTDFSTRLQLPTDMSLPAIIHMFEMLAPKIATILKDHLEVDHLNTFLRNETDALADIVPTDISNHFNYGAASTRMGRTSKFIEGTVKELTPYPKQ